MPPRRPSNEQVVRQAFDLYRRLPLAAQVALAVLVVVGVGLYMAGAFHPRPGGPGSASAAVPPGDYLFCFWNVENLFDDRDDKRGRIDDPYDNWAAGDGTTRRQKYDHLADTLLKMNGGKGPDVLACVEVESVRAGELLRDTLNARLPAGVAPYTHVLMKEVDAGRHIAPCVITRLGADPSPRLRVRGLRLLETHITANGHDLCLVASHWTSQLQQQDGGHGEAGREKYARALYDAAGDALRADPNADVLVCGDFNATPDSPEVANDLHLTADRSAVVPARTGFNLFGLLSGKPADRFGTIYYNKPLIYDQIGVSAGLLDRVGWGCDPDSVKVATDGLIAPGTRTRKPWRFGNQNETTGRGYSDHFPVTVTLTVGPPK